MPDLAKARDLAQQLVTALADEPPAPSTAISTPEAFDRALAAAAPGDSIALAPELVYPRPLTLRRPVMLINRAALQSRRMTRDAPAPRFLGGVTIASDSVGLLGLEARHPDRGHAIVEVTGAHLVLDSCRLLGDPIVGQKRGIAGNGAHGTYIRNYVEDCWGPYPGDDCQAFCAWDTPGPILLEDNYLCGSTETVMFGGADPSSEANIPSDLIIRGNTITKNPAWQTQMVSVKNALELKNCRRVLIENNDITYSWGGHGQDGYLLMLTVRNQDGRAPWSTIRDVIIRDNRLAHGAAAINVLALDNITEQKAGRPTPVGQVRPSVRMQQVAIAGNVFDDLDPAKYTGSKKMIQIQRGPLQFAIDGNTFKSPGGLTSVLYFDGQPPAEQLVVSHNVWPKTRYGIFGTGAAMTQPGQLPPAWQQFVASGALTDNVETP